MADSIKDMKKKRDSRLGGIMGEIQKTRPPKKKVTKKKATQRRY